MPVVVPTAKHPSAKWRYKHSFAEALLVEGQDVGDTLVPITDPDITKRPTVEVKQGTITVPQFELDGANVLYWVEGGKSNSSCVVRVTAWTANGRKLVEDVVVPIERIL